MSSPRPAPTSWPFALPQVFTLASGLTLVHQFRPSPAVVADVWVRAGVAQEEPDQQGMAHFLEHLVFKGSKRLGPGDFDRLVENQGGVTNAATSYDYAHFFVNTAVDQLPEALAALAELLLGAELAPESIDREREVVLEEIRQTENNPDWVAFQHFLQQIYGEHPYGRSILGTPEQLQRHSAPSLRQFYQTHYHPSNLTVVVVGGMGLEECQHWVDRSLGTGTPPPVPPSPPLSPCPPFPPRPTAPRWTDLHLPQVEQTRVILGWRGPEVQCPASLGDGGDLKPGNLAEILALELWAVILAGGRSSPWVQTLREERQWVQGISTNFLQQRQSSLFSLNLWPEDPYLEAVIDWICEDLTRWQTQWVEVKTLQQAKRLLRHEFIFATETHGQLAGLYGYYGAIAQVEWSAAYFTVLEQLQPEDLRSALVRYLSPQSYTAIALQSPLAAS